MSDTPYRMKGHTLPGINQRSEGDTDLSDGRSGSAAFQYRSPAKNSGHKGSDVKDHHLTDDQKKKKRVVEMSKENEGKPGFNEYRDKLMGGKTTVEGMKSTVRTSAS